MKSVHPKAITKLLLHLHPQKVNAQAVKFTRTFGLGGMAALLFVLLFLSGMLLRFAYVPSEKGAYDSILELQNQVLFGQFLRNLHYWSGMLLVLVSFLHLLRVFYSQSIYFERRKTWMYGLVMLFVAVLSNFTGYLLPWDQLSFWAVTIMTNMLSYIPLLGSFLAEIVRGGEEVTETTLLRFYHFHTGLLPLLMVSLMSVHFWLIRKSKGVTVQNSEDREMVPVNPDLIYREILVALILIIVIFFFSMLIDAPLQGKANPLVSPNPSKAPWYFMGFQELLIHVHPMLGVFVIPLLVVAFLIYIPLTNYTDLRIGKWFDSEKGKKLTLFSVVFAVILTVLFVLVGEFLGNQGSQLSILMNGGLSTLLYCLLIAIYLYVLKKQYKATKINLVTALFTIIMAAYIVMTIVGLLRGEGMHLFA